MATADDGAGAPDRAACEHAVAEIRRAFETFAFGSTVRLARSFLERGPQLTERESAEVHGMLALAAHNRQFRTDQGDERFARFSSTTCTGRSTRSRDRPIGAPSSTDSRSPPGGAGKAVGEALAWSARAVERCGRGDVDSPQAAYQEAWARNIRAYLMALSRRPADSKQEAETALELADEVGSTDLSEASQGERDYWWREATFSQAVLAHNLGTLARFGGDAREETRIRTLARERSSHFRDTDHLESHTWVDLHRHLRRPDLALEAALEGIAGARKRTTACGRPSTSTRRPT